MKKTKEEIQTIIEAVEDMFKGLPKSKQLNYLGNLNEIMLFLEALKREAAV